MDKHIDKDCDLINYERVAKRGVGVGGMDVCMTA